MNRQKIQQSHTNLKNVGKEVIFCWLPSHIGITGNRKADQAAKRALDQEPDVSFPHTDLLPLSGQVGDTSQIKERPVNSICSHKTDRFIHTVRPEKSGCLIFPAFYGGGWFCGGKTRSPVSRRQGL